MRNPYVVGLISGLLSGITFSLILLALIMKPKDHWEDYK